MSSAAPAVVPVEQRLSKNCAAVWASACAEARTRGHLQVSSEHVLYALCAPGDAAGGSVAARWLEGCGLARAKVREWLDTARLLQFFQEAHDQPSGRTVSFGPSPSILRALKWAHRAAGGETEGIGAAAEVTTELLLAGLLRDGTCVAARVVDDLLPGRATYASLVARLADAGALDMTAVASADAGIDRDAKASAAGWARDGGAGGAGGGAGGDGDDDESKAGGVVGGDGDVPWTVFSTSGAAGGDTGAGDAAELPELPTSDGDIAKRMKISVHGRTAEFCWLVPDRVAMGPAPWGADTVSAILGCGVTTFVDLRHESRGRASYFFGRGGARDAVRATGTTLSYVHMPIHDFDAVDGVPMQSFIAELVRRVRAGEVLYIHCAGGHGRTGTVAINLLSALYSMPMGRAWAAVKKFHNQRAGCSDYCHVPEEARQKRLVYALTGAAEKGKK